MEKTASGPLRKRVILVPFPFQGHLTPMLQLGSVLDSHGFSITVMHTKFNFPNPSDHPTFTFLPLSDGLDGYDMSFYNLLNTMAVMNENCEAPFEEHVMRMLEEEAEGSHGEVACIVYDTIMKFVEVVTSKIRVPSVVLRTTSAAYMHSHVVMFQLVKDKVFPLPESEMHAPIPEVHALRFKDLPLPATQEIAEPVLDFLESYTDIKSSSAVIFNTVESLDHWALQQLQHHWPVPFFPVGPLHKMTQPLQTSLHEEDSTCLSWLDKQSPNSVLFVSLGSLAVIDEEELIEMAWGIAKSEQPFLWAMRPSLLSGSDPIKSLPLEFKEMTKDRSCIVKWAPQKKVLAHSAVGGFLTHCGWNSTLEGICEGVPLICRPCFSDQMVNARYMTQEWRIGVELENTTEGAFERAIRTLMESEEGKMMEQRVLELKQELEHAIHAGDSRESLGRLVEFITSLRTARR